VRWKDDNELLVKISKESVIGEMRNACHSEDQGVAGRTVL